MIIKGKEGGADEKIVVRNFRGKKIGQRVLQACVLPRATRSTAIGSWIDRVGDLMTHDLLRQTSKPRIPPSIPLRVESRIRRSSTLLSLFLHWFPFFPFDQDYPPPPFPLPLMITFLSFGYVSTCANTGWSILSWRPILRFDVSWILNNIPVLSLFILGNGNFRIFQVDWSRNDTMSLRNRWMEGSSSISSDEIRAFPLGDKFISKTISIVRNIRLHETTIPVKINTSHNEPELYT